MHYLFDFVWNVCMKKMSAFICYDNTGNLINSFFGVKILIQVLLNT